MINFIKYSRWFLVPVSVVITGVIFTSPARQGKVLKIEDMVEAASKAAELSVAYQFNTINVSTNGSTNGESVAAVSTYTSPAWPSQRLLSGINHFSSASTNEYNGRKSSSDFADQESFYGTNYWTQFMGPYTNETWEMSSLLYGTNIYGQPVVGNVIYWKFLYNYLMDPVKTYFGKGFKSPETENSHRVWWINENGFSDAINADIGERNFYVKEETKTNTYHLSVPVGGTINHTIPGTLYSITGGVGAVKFLTMDSFNSSNAIPKLYFPQDMVITGLLTNVYSYLPTVNLGFGDSVNYSPDSSANGLWEGKGTFWSKAGLGTNVWMFHSAERYMTITNMNVESVYNSPDVTNYSPEVVIIYDRSLLTNKLTELKKCLDPLKQTLVVKDCSDILPYPDTMVKSESTTMVMTNFDWTATSWEQVLTHYGPQTTAAYTNISKRSFTGSLAHQYLSGDGDAWSSVSHDSYYGDTSDAGFLYNVEQWGSSFEKVENASFDYPSLWAITNGYVDRVRIYVSIEYASAAAIPAPPTDYVETSDSGTGWNYTESTTRTGTADFTRPDSFSAITYGLSFLFSSIFVPGSFTVSNDRYDYGTFPVNHVYINKIYDQKPTGRISFTLGLDSLDPDKQAYQQASMTKNYYKSGSYMPLPYPSTETATYDDTYDGQDTWYKTEHSFAIKKFFILVDWNWQHLNSDKPFVPDINHPDWLKPYTGSVTNYSKYNATNVLQKL